MQELAVRSLSGIIYMGLLITAVCFKTALVVLLFVFGLLCLIEFSKLIKLKSFIQYIIYTLFFSGFWYLYHSNLTDLSDKITQILLVVTIFVNLLLIKDLFTERSIPLFQSKRFITTTFYLSSGFIFILLIANFNYSFTPILLLGSFILIWVNDSGAYLIGKKFGVQKLFPSVSPKKTVEGFLGGLFFSCVASFFIASYTTSLKFTNWLILAIIVSVLGTFGDLIESKFKRQADVKDSGIIMPGHGGLLDRLDSIIFTAPFIYFFLRIIHYVS